MDEIGLDLLLLAVRPDGTLPLPEKLRFGLAGSELVRLAAARRIDIVRGRITVISTAPTGDSLLDDALASMAAKRLGAPTAKAWVARHRPGLVERYLSREETAGRVSRDRRKALGFIPVTRWTVVDTARAAQARARLEAAAASTGPLSQEEAAVAGLASATGLTRYVFPGRDGAAARKRLREAARSEALSADAVQAVSGAARAANSAAVDAATQAAISAATDAATQAAHSAGGHAGAAGGHH